MKVVLDTNILVSALFWKGKEQAVLDRCRTKEHRLVLSPFILGELGRVLDTKFEVPKEKIESYAQNLILMSIFVFPSTEIDAIKEDKADNMVLECAIGGNADLIISGDKHLLKLKEFSGIKILNANELIQKH